MEEAKKKEAEAVGLLAVDVNLPTHALTAPVPMANGCHLEQLPAQGQCCCKHTPLAVAVEAAAPRKTWLSRLSCRSSSCHGPAPPPGTTTRCCQDCRRRRAKAKFFAIPVWKRVVLVAVHVVPIVLLTYGLAFVLGAVLEEAMPPPPAPSDLVMGHPPPFKAVATAGAEAAKAFHGKPNAGVKMPESNAVGTEEGWWKKWWRLHRWDRSLADECPFIADDFLSKEPIFTFHRGRLFKNLYEALKEEAREANEDLRNGTAAVNVEDFRIVLGSASRPIRDGSDAEYSGYKQNANVEYLVGPFKIANAVFVLTPTKAAVDEPRALFRLVLYLPEQSEREAVFTGSFPSRDDLILQHGLDDVKPIKELRADLGLCEEEFEEEDCGKMMLMRRHHHSEEEEHHHHHHHHHDHHHEDEDDDDDDEEEKGLKGEKKGHGKGKGHKHHGHKKHKKPKKPKHPKHPPKEPEEPPKEPEEPPKEPEEPTPPPPPPSVRGRIPILLSVLSELPRVVASSLSSATCSIEDPPAKPSVRILNAFAKSRFIKTPYELDALNAAGKLAAYAHRRVELYLAHAHTANEVEVAAEFVKASAVCGGELQAYPAIVGAGPHGAVLHYRTGEDRKAGYTPIPRGELVLIDASPEVLGYASDLTRTYLRGGGKPAEGKRAHGGVWGFAKRVWKRLVHAFDDDLSEDGWPFPKKPHPKIPITPEREEVLGIVKRVQEKTVSERYGESKWWYGDVVLPTMEHLTLELRDAGFLIGENVTELVALGAAGIFMPHGLGHPVGLEVHDPTPLFDRESRDITLHVASKNGPLSRTSSTFGTHSDALRWPLAAFPESSAGQATPTHPNAILSFHNGDEDLVVPYDFTVPRGHVATIEPGVYFIPKLLERVKVDPVLGKVVNWAKVEGGKYAEKVGGVRIEDVVAVDLAGQVKVFTRF
ncbi:hypothetical protein HDU96_006969 [Phlyctochytrium bullatum]|nr:hypothetical protein HDU96_006969 [Phlyctochytrium bullatum]